MLLNRNWKNAAECGWFGPFMSFWWWNTKLFYLYTARNQPPNFESRFETFQKALWSKFAAVCLHKGMVIPPQQPEDICSNNFHTRSRSIFRLKTVEPWTTQCFPTKTLFQDLETHNKQAGLDIVRICTRTRYHIKPGTQGLDAAILTEFLGCHSLSISL